MRRREDRKLHVARVPSTARGVHDHGEERRGVPLPVREGERAVRDEGRRDILRHGRGPHGLARARDLGARAPLLPHPVHHHAQMQAQQGHARLHVLSRGGGGPQRREGVLPLLQGRPSEKRREVFVPAERAALPAAWLRAHAVGDGVRGLPRLRTRVRTSRSRRIPSFSSTRRDASRSRNPKSAGASTT